MTECTHGFDDPRHCADCMFEGNVAPNRITVHENPFRAKYDGPCALCDKPIHPGDLIFGRSDRSHIHYRHAPRVRLKEP